MLKPCDDTNIGSDGRNTSWHDINVTRFRRWPDAAIVFQHGITAHGDLLLAPEGIRVKLSVLLLQQQ